MSSNIVLNKLNITNSGNNSLVYKFPNTVKFEEGDQVAISHLNLYYSWFNITKKYNNNMFQYKWWDVDGNLTDVRTVLIPDGFYSVSTLYEYVQKTLVDNKHYLVTDTGDFVYFIEFLTNSTYYAVEIRLSSLSEQYIIDQNLQYPSNAGWVAPKNTLDGSTTIIHYATPHVIIPSNNSFGALLGFKAQTIYETTDISDQFSFLNDSATNMNPSSSFIVTCSLVDNPLGIPNNIIYSFALNSVAFGDMINTSTDVLYSKIKAGSYNEFRINIQDQDFNQLQILDPNLLIVLSIIKH